MGPPLPPIDHVARALLMNGAREPAIALMESMARRGGPDGARCAALLSAVRARPTDRPTGPVIPLDSALVEALAASGMLPEARAVARGGRIAAKGGVELAAALEQVHEDPPPALPEARRRAWAAVLAGSIEAAVALEREGPALDAWLGPRVALASRLLRGFSVDAPTASGSPLEGDSPALPAPVRTALADKIAARDLPGALAVVRAAQGGDPTLGEIVAALARLVVATERLMEETNEPAGRASTTPLGGHGLALFQLRMGNVADAERAFRRLVVEQANDHVARERLTDVILLRRAVDPSSAGLAGASGSDVPGAAEGAAASIVLDKKHARPAAAGWAAGGAGSKPPARAPSPGGDWDQEIATSVMRPEQEAEMLLRGGRPERALEVLERLRAKDPDRAGLAARIEEIERMIEERAAPLPGEHTVRRDLSELRASADARGAGAPAAPSVPSAAAADDFDEQTMIGRRPRMAEHVPDPLAHTQAGASGVRGPAAPGPATREEAPRPPREVTAVPEVDDTVVAVHRILPIE